MYDYDLEEDVDEFDGLRAECGDVSMSGNAVVDLNSFAQKSGISIPTYEDIGSRGGRGEDYRCTVFFIKCSLQPGVEGIGKGYSKKVAKKASASAVIRLLRELGEADVELLMEVLAPLEKDITDLNFRGQMELRKNFNVYILGVPAKDPKVLSSLPNTASGFKESFSTWTGTKVEALKTMSYEKLATCRAFDLIERISKEQNLDMEILDLAVVPEERKSQSRCLLFFPNYQYLNRVGQGEDRPEALDVAAFKVLDFLRIMLSD